MSTLWASLSSKQQYMLVVVAGSALRLALFNSTSIPAALESRPELTTPLTAIRSLKEGVFLHSTGANPYRGGVFHHSPLYLTLLHVGSQSAVTWTLADALAAMALTRIKAARGSTIKDPFVAALYLFNPYAVMTCLARSTTSMDNALLLLAISASDAYITGPLLALAVHTSLYPALLLPPFAMMAARSSRLLVFLSTFLVTFIGLSLIWSALFGRSWLSATWGLILTVSDLTPNVGMWWYFFTEMFDHFRIFFLGVFQLHNVIYVAPVCLRLRHDPRLAILVLTGVFSTWKSYPTLGDMAVWAGLLGCFPELVSNLRHPLFTLTVHLYTLILLPLLHSLWLLTGTGNANFFYAATMVYGLNASLAAVDVLGATFRLQVKKSVHWQEDWAVVQLNAIDT